MRTTARRVILLALLLSAAIAVGQASVPESAPPTEPAAPALFAGERLAYRFDWSGLVAAEARIAVEEAEHQGRRCYRITADIQTRPALDWIWKVRDRIEVLAEVGTLRPLHYRFLQREGLFHHDTEIVFDQEGKKAHAERRYRGKVKRTTIDFDEIYDPFTAIYVLRAAPPAPGEVRRIEVFDGHRRYTVQYEGLAEEVIDTRLGRRRVLRLRPSIVRTEPPLKKKQSEKSTQVRKVILWMDREGRGDIYRIESDVTVGAIHADLVEREGS